MISWHGVTDITFFSLSICIIFLQKDETINKEERIDGRELSISKQMHHT